MLVRRGPRRPDDRGAVAVMVSITVVAVLIPTAALALDLGNVYTRTSSLQQAADEAATAAAGKLAADQWAGLAPSTAMADARAVAVDVLCHQPALAPDRDGDGVAAGPWRGLCAGGTGWTSDGHRDNGEVVFYRGSPLAETLGNRYLAGQLADGSTPVTGVSVVAPPFRVEYGLASVFGRGDHADLSRTATATLRTVLPRDGFAPLYALPLDSSGSGSYCARNAVSTLSLSSNLLSDPCRRLRSYRGYLNVPNPRAATSDRRLTYNMSGGLDPTQLPTTPTFGGSCPAPIGAPLSCLPVQRTTSTSGTFSTDMMRGLYGYLSGNVTGRLSRPGCGGQGLTRLSGSTVSGAPSPYQAETARLSGFLSTPTDVHSSLSPAVLTCGRLAAIPQLNLPDSALLGTGGLPLFPVQVTGIKLLWIDDVPGSSVNSCWRGVVRGSSCSSTATAITGQLLDPHQLPALVTGAAAANDVDYLGAGLPATVRLIRDSK